MDLLEIIRNRRTIRIFSDREIKKEDLKAIIDLGRLAPSGANLQSSKFIGVIDKALRKKIFENLKWAGYTAPKGVPDISCAPTGYIVCLIDEDIRKDGDNDCSYAEENMVIGAEALGISSCILGSVNREKIKKILNIPDNQRIHMVIALGYKAQSSSFYDCSDNIKYSINEKGDFSVPKRPFDEIAKIF